MSSEKHLILLVEDDKALAQFLAAQLSYFNYEVVVKHDLSDLDAEIARSQPAAILMDVTFPEGDLAGPQHLAALSSQGRQLPPVIIFSGRTDFAARLAAIRAGAIAYFPKPLDCLQVVEKLDSLMPEHRSEPYKVLVIDDSPSLTQFFEATLQAAGMETRAVNDPQKAEEVLATFLADLILMDMHMPSCSGTELAEILRTQEKYLSIPIVFLSSDANAEIQASALRSGADDYLTKPVDPAKLIETIDVRVERHRNLRKLMVRDSLTGLLNHSTFEEMLDVERSKALRQQRPLAMAMIDIDHFKRVNDTYGHPAGDNVIRSLARMLKQRLRMSDIVGRYGGEEFAVAMPDTTAQQAGAVMEGILRDFSKLAHRAVGKTFACSFSCGITELKDKLTSAQLTSMADMALYKAKQEGRNRVRQHTQE